MKRRLTRAAVLLILLVGLPRGAVAAGLSKLDGASALGVTTDRYKSASDAPLSRPAAPSDLTAFGTSAGPISLSWTDNSTNESGFDIERAPSAQGPWSTIGKAGVDITTYTDVGGAEATTYYYRVRAYNPQKESLYSNVASTTGYHVRPMAPSNLAATAISASQINLSWMDNAGNESGFKVERATSSAGPFTQVGMTAANATRYSDRDLTSSMAYYYRVQAYNAAGDSGYSNTANATTQSASLAAPSGLTATAASASQINLKWTDNAGIESGFKVERATSSGGPFSQIGIAAANATTYADSGLTASTTYYYRVRAYSTAGDSAYSNTANATTQGAAPAAPSGLTATAASASQINLSWIDNASNESGFYVERALSASGPFTQIGTAAANATTYADGGLTASTTYHYRVRSFNTAGNSAYSNTAVAATQPAGNGAHIWSQGYGGTVPTDEAWSTDVAVDGSGNIFMTGRFRGTVNLGGGPVTSTDDWDLFLAKYSPSGAHLWSKRFAGPWDKFGNEALGIVTDGNGNVIITGVFFGTLNFGGQALSGTNRDTFIAKFSANGAHIWSRNFPSGCQDVGRAVAVDQSGNVLLTGEFQSGEINFGGGPLITPAGEPANVYLAKFDPNGNHIWSKSFGDNLLQSATGVTTDYQDNVIITGYLRGAIDFGGGRLGPSTPNAISGPSYDIYLAKFSPGGTHLWSKTISDSEGQEQIAYAVSTDAEGNVAITGTVVGTVNFGGASLRAVGLRDIFAAKYTAAGTHLWSKRFGYSGKEQFGYGAAFDRSGNLALTGGIVGRVDFGGGALPFPDGEWLYNVFVVKLSSAGDHLWSKSFGDYYNQKGRAVATDSTGNVVVTGEFNSTIDFGGGPLRSPDTSTASAFLNKRE